MKPIIINSHDNKWTNIYQLASEVVESMKDKDVNTLYAIVFKDGLEQELELFVRRKQHIYTITSRILRVEHEGECVEAEQIETRRWAVANLIQDLLNKNYGS